MDKAAALNAFSPETAKYVSAAIHCLSDEAAPTAAAAPAAAALEGAGNATHAATGGTEGGGGNAQCKELKAFTTDLALAATTCKVRRRLDG